MIIPSNISGDARDYLTRLLAFEDRPLLIAAFGSGHFVSRVMKAAGLSFEDVKAFGAALAAEAGLPPPEPKLEPKPAAPRHPEDPAIAARWLAVLDQAFPQNSAYNEQQLQFYVLEAQHEGVDPETHLQNRVPTYISYLMSKAS